MPPAAASPPAVTVAGGTTVAAPGTGRGPPRRQRLAKAAKPLPTLLQRPRLPPPLTLHTPHPIRPATIVKHKDAEEEGDASGNQSTSTVSDVLRLMDALRLPVEADLYAMLIKECTERRDAAHGAEVHAHIRRFPGGTPTLLANRLMLMYAASGRVEEAWEVLDGMPTRGATSWATMIAGLSHAGGHRGALRLFAEMMHEKGRPVDVGPAGVLSIAAVLRSAGGAGDLAFGKCVHGLVLKIGGVARLVSRLIHVYGMLDQADCACRVFTSAKDECGSAAWNAMVFTYCRLGMVGKAFELVGEMSKARMRLSGPVLSSVLKACGRREEQLPGRQAHACAVKVGVEGDLLVLCSLVEMYGRCGLVFDARTALEMVIGRRYPTGAAAAFRNAMLGVFTEDEGSVDAIRSLCGIQDPRSMTPVTGRSKHCTHFH